MKPKGIMLFLLLMIGNCAVSNAQDDVFDYLIKGIRQIMNDTTGTSELLHLNKKESPEDITIYTKQLMQLLNQINDTDDVRDGLDTLGIRALESEKYQEAIGYFEQYAKARKDAGDRKGYAYAIRHLSTAHAYISNYQKAVYYGLEAAQLDEELGDSIGLAADYISLGMVQLNVREYDKAQKYFEKALHQCKDRDQKLERNANYYLGNLHMNIGQKELALQYFQQARQLDKASNHLNNLIDDCISMSYVYFSNKDTIRMARCLIEGVDYVRQNSMQASSLNALVKMATLERMLGKYDDAENTLKMVTLYGPLTDKVQDVAKGTELLAYVYADKKDYENAYKTFLEYRELNDSLFNADKNREVKKLEVEYESAKKERALAKSEKEKKEKDLILAVKEKELFSARLKQAEKEKELALSQAETRSSEKQLAEEKLQKAEKEKQLAVVQNEKLKAEALYEQQRTEMIYIAIAIAAVLVLLSAVYYYIQRQRRQRYENEIRTTALVAHKSQMNQHFTFNSLQSVRKFILFKPEQADDYLQRFSDFIRSVLHQSGSIDVPLQQELNEVENYLQLEQMRFDNLFDYSIYVDKGIDAASVKVPSLIFQPLVENAIVHGFAGIDYVGHISLNVMMQNKNLVCTVTDNGIGRKPKSDMQEPGRKSMGTDLTRKRIYLYNQIKSQKAVFEIRDLAQGVEVIFTLPKVKAA